MKSFYTYALLGLLALCAFPSGAAAQGTNVGGTPGGGTNVGGTPAPSTGGLQNPLKDIDSLPEFLNAILSATIQIGTIVLTLMIIYVGFKFVMARGNAEKLSEARNALIWTVIGGLILLGASAIGAMLQSTVNSIRA